MNLTNLKRWAIQLAPSLGPLERWFRATFALDRRYGVRYNAGIEKNGFYTDLEAEGWAQFKGLPKNKYIIFHYDPIDLRMLGADTKIDKERYLP